MPNVKLTITESNCRCGYHHSGETFLVGDICPPVCHELWSAVYPMVYALQNGALLDFGAERCACFDAQCPDGGRVKVHGERID